MKIRLAIAFFIGIVFCLFLITAVEKIRSFTIHDGEEKDLESAIFQPFQISEKFYRNKGFNFVMPNAITDEVRSFSASKSSFGFYNPNSTCIAEFEVLSGFGEGQNGKSYGIRILAFDFSSVEAKTECSKFAIESIIPISIKGNFVEALKKKIFEEGTILKTFSKEDIIEAERTNSPLVHDGGFVMENLNIAIISSPYRFEIFITDCKNTKCE